MNPLYVNLRSFLDHEIVHVPASSIGRGKFLRLTVRVMPGSYDRPIYKVENGKGKYVLTTQDPVAAVDLYNQLLDEQDKRENARVLKYAKGDLVMFSRGCQNCEGGMRIEAVDRSSDAPYQIDYKWWGEGNLMPFEEWKTLYRSK